MPRAKTTCRFLLLGLLLALPMGGEMAAQRWYETWRFGFAHGLDFSTRPPTPLADGSIAQKEGSATINDPRTGELLFYTDGVTVWDRTHRPMPNGTDLGGSFTSVQSALILPFPCDSHRFVVVTADHQGYETSLPPPRGLRYSVVDMRLNGGLGDVTAQKNLLLLDTASERITAVAHANGFDYWIIGHSRGERVFHAWRLTAQGLDTAAVRSQAGLYQGYRSTALAESALGMLKASPDGRMLVQTTTSMNLAELFRFDASTGVVSTAITLYQGSSGPEMVYGASFSADSRRLYHTVDGTVMEYDLSTFDSTVVRASARLLPSTRAPGDRFTGWMALGPDSLIYVVTGKEMLGTIRSGSDSTPTTYDESAVGLAYRLSQSIGLSNAVDALHRSRLSSDTIDLCEGDSLLLEAPIGGARYEWSTGEVTRSILVREGGVYRVRYFSAEGCQANGLFVVVQRARPEVPTLTRLVDTLVASTPDGATLSWYRNDSLLTGRTGERLVVRRPGRYHVEAVTPYGCRARSRSEYVLGLHTVRLDTVAGRVGDLLTLRLNFDPPIDVEEELRRLRVTVGYGAASIVVRGVEATAGGSVSVERGRGEAVITLARGGELPPFQGTHLADVVVEGLSTATPYEPVAIRECAWLLDGEEEPVAVSGHGLVLLSGCRIGLETFGRRAAIVQIHPNPAGDAVALQLRPTDEGGRLQLEIVSLLGERELRAEVAEGSDRISLDLTTLPPGLHLLRLRDGDLVTTRLLMIER